MIHHSFYREVTKIEVRTDNYIPTNQDFPCFISYEFFFQQFEFNHIDKNLSESDIKTLKDFYKHYYKKFWCFKKSYKRFKLLDESITISGICLMIIPRDLVLHLFPINRLV